MHLCLHAKFMLDPDIDTGFFMMQTYYLSHTSPAERDYSSCTLATKLFELLRHFLVYLARLTKMVLLLLLNRRK